MNGLPYYKRYPRDFIEGTIGLSFELKAAYGLVLDLIYMQGGNLPDDSRYISGLLSVSIRKWKSLRNQLIEIGKIQVSGEFLTNYRAVSELETSLKHQDKQRENRSRPNKINGLQSPKADHSRDYTDTDTDTDSKIPPKPPTGGMLVSIGSAVPGKFEEEDFERFWKGFPAGRKRGKGQCREKFKKLIIKTGIDPDVIIDAAILGKGIDPDYPPMPATWLNQGRWEDEVHQSCSKQKTKRQSQTDFLRQYVSGTQEKELKNVTPKLNRIAADSLPDDGK